MTDGVNQSLIQLIEKLTELLTQMTEKNMGMAKAAKANYDPEKEVIQIVVEDIKRNGRVAQAVKAVAERSKPQKDDVSDYPFNVQMGRVISDPIQKIKEYPLTRLPDVSMIVNKKHGGIILISREPCAPGKYMETSVWISR